MSLYNMLFGVNPMAGILMQALGIEHKDVPRFRDCYLDDNDGKPRIALHTRTGGGNRDDYHEENETLTKIAGYQFDEDDDFDCTYATFYYDVPPAFAAIIATMREISGGTENPAGRWQKLFVDLKSGEQNDTTGRAIKVAEGIIEKLKGGDPA